MAISLITTTTPVHADVVNPIITQVNANASVPMEILITSGFASGWTGEIRMAKTHQNVVNINVLLIKNSDISSTAESIFTLPIEFRPKSGTVALQQIGLQSPGGNLLANTTSNFFVTNTGILTIQPIEGASVLNARRFRATLNYIIYQ